jgi:hypothetical protein
MVIVSDQPPPSPSPADAAKSPTRPQNAGPRPGSSAFWRRSTGTKAPLQTGDSKTASATTETAVAGLPIGPGRELVRQFFGTASSPATAKAPAMPAQPSTVAANEPTTPATDGPLPQQDSVEVASYDSTELLSQLGLPPDETESQATTGTAAVPRKESVWKALARPLIMTTDAPPLPRPGSEPTAVATAEKPRPRPESETVPSLLRPFYMTDNRSVAGASQTAQPTTAIAPLESTLARQLTLSSEEYLQAAQANPSEAPSGASSAVAIEPWINQWQSLANPILMTQTVAQPGASGGGELVQVAYLQETLPPPDANLEPDDMELPGGSAKDDDSAEKKDGDGKGQEGGLVGADKLGNAPEDTSLEFLRTATVLLKPGDMQFDIGFEYTLTENNFPILLVDGMGTIVGVDDVEFKGRELAVPMEIRFGLLKRVQAFLQVPVGWSNTQVAIDNFDAFQNDGGLGDIAWGATVQLQDATKDRPYIVGTLAALAPTGGDPFTGVVGFSPSAPSLGNGFWALSANLLWIETRYDPVVLFYGLGARRQFEHKYLGIEFEPGQEYNYTLGFGFSVNERVTLSTQFFGSYIEELKANGERVEGTIQEPMNIQLAATFVNRCDRIVEPFVSFGLTNDSISANVGVTWTY